VADPAENEPDLTPEERAQLRVLLRLIRRAGGKVDAPTPVKVERPKIDAAAHVAKLRRKKGLR
jgi:hypothetical protein